MLMNKYDFPSFTFAVIVIFVVGVVVARQSRHLAKRKQYALAEREPALTLLIICYH